MMIANEPLGDSDEGVKLAKHAEHFATLIKSKPTSSMVSQVPEASCCLECVEQKREIDCCSDPDPNNMIWWKFVGIPSLAFLVIMQVMHWFQ